jgi:hypothetical protein
MHESVIAIITRKHPLFIGISFVYLTLLVLVKWFVTPTIGTAMFVLGGITGIFFLDVAEYFFKLSPSPFRSIVFMGGFVAVSVFIITSSGSMLASGLVLTTFITMILWQVGEWQMRGSLSSWYAMMAHEVSIRNQLVVLMLFVCAFILLTAMFLR